MLWGNFPSPRKRLDLVGGGYADLRSLELSGNLLETWEVSEWQVKGGTEGAASSASLSHVRHVITHVGPTACDDVAL